MENKYKSLRKYIMLARDIRPTSRPADANNTWIEKRGKDVAVKFHYTDILIYHPDGSVVLNSGGWKTVTTKARMNQFLPRGIYISQENHIWYVHNKETDEQVPYKDGMVISADGALKGGMDDEAVTESKELNDKINRYA